MGRKGTLKEFFFRCRFCGKLNRRSIQGFVFLRRPQFCGRDCKRAYYEEIRMEGEMIGRRY